MHGSFKGDCAAVAGNRASEGGHCVGQAVYTCCGAALISGCLMHSVSLYKGKSKGAAMGNRSVIFCVFLIVIVFMLGGCVAGDLHIKPDYRSFGDQKAITSKITLASPVESGSQPSSGQIQWVIGEMKNSDGMVRGNIVIPVSPAMIVREALQQELQKGGYQVQSVIGGLPAGADSGLVLSAVSLHLDETGNLVKTESECRVSFSIEVWKKGAKVNTLSYEARYSDFAIRDRDKLHQAVLQKGLESILKRAVPELIKVLSS